MFNDEAARAAELKAARAAREQKEFSQTLGRVAADKERLQVRTFLCNDPLALSISVHVVAYAPVMPHYQHLRNTCYIGSGHAAPE